MHYTHTLLAHAVLIQLIPAQTTQHNLSCTTYLLHYLSFDPLAHKLKPQTKPMNLNKHLSSHPQYLGCNHANQSRSVREKVQGLHKEEKLRVGVLW